MNAANMPRIDTLLLCASITTVGLYACSIWERSLRGSQHQMYVDAAIRVIDVLWNGGGRGVAEGARARAARARTSVE